MSKQLAELIERGYALLEEEPEGQVKASAFVYPWDVNGDPEAPGADRRASAWRR